MSFGGLILTNTGRNKIAASISNEIPLKFSYIQLGDGVYNGSYLSKKELTNMVMQIPITRVQRENNEVLIECDWSDRQAPSGFYLREIGIFSENDILCYYDNAGTGDTEYIDPDSDVVTKQKRFRFTVIISDEINVTTQTSSGLYALKEDVEHIDETKVDKEPGKVLSEHNFTTELLNKLNHIDDTQDSEKPVSVPVQEALDAYYAQLTAYTDKAIADLINGAPTTLDTLKELADAIKENQNVQAALDAAIGTKASKAEYDSHVLTSATATVSGHVKVDSALSASSANPVQNKVVKAALDNKSTSDLKDNIVTFTQAATRTNITTKEKLSIMLGKIAKYFTDLKKVAFTGSYTDLTNKPNIPSVPETNIVMIKVKHGVANTSMDGSFTLSRADFAINKTWTPNCIFITSHNVDAVARYDYDASKQSLTEGYDYLWFRTNMAGMVRYTILLMIPNDQTYV